MEASTATLIEDPTALKVEVLALREKVSLLEERIRQLIHKRFGTSSEKFSPDQINLFNEAEQEASEGEPEQDETVVQVLKEPDKTPQNRSYMWVQVAEPVTGQRVILFDYSSSRSGSVPVKLLEGYQGYLQTDGYEGYATIGRQNGIISQGCCTRRA